MDQEELPEMITNDLKQALILVNKRSVPGFTQTLQTKLLEYREHYLQQAGYDMIAAALFPIEAYSELHGKSGYLLLARYCREEDKSQNIGHGFFLLVNDDQLCYELQEVAFDTKQ